MSITSRLAALVLPRYQNDAERLARLDRLRQSLMNEWESNLEWGSGNDLEHVPTTMIVGLVDAVRWAQILVAPNPPSYAADRLRESIDKYLRDLDYIKWRRLNGLDRS